MLDLSIRITPATIDAIKARLREALPDVKSSHRIEAAARSFGFGTYAAMRHASQSGACHIAGPDGSAFSSYLENRGFKSSPIHIYRAAANVAVTSVMEKGPRLSIWGYGFGQPHWISERKRWETEKERYEKFTKDRAEFLSNGGLDQFLLALALVRRIPKTKTIRKGTGSYRLKHIAENMPFACPDGTKLGPRYVANGALIAAALYAGFKMKTYVDHLGYDHINVSFNMSKKAIDDLDCEMRPNSGFSQDRARALERRKKPWLYH